MSGARQRRHRPSAARHRSVRHVEPVLDPTWHSPYAPSSEERLEHREAIRRAAWRRQRLTLVGAGVLVVASIALVAVAWYVAICVLVIAGGVVALAINHLNFYELEIPRLAEQLRSKFIESGTDAERSRLATIVDRLSATFGITGVEMIIVADPAYNATLLPSEDNLCLLVTNSLLVDFDLIEIEGVIAHLMARQRLGLIEREAAAAVSGLSESDAHRLAGSAMAYRADEVAAASIRYPLGLAQALRHCVEHKASGQTFFATPAYRASRWVWFDIFCDVPSSIDGEVDDAEVRSRALAEW